VNYYYKILFSLLTVYLTGSISLVQAQSLGEATIDSDGDGLTDVQETTIYHTDPLKADTDGDGFSDSEEISHGYSPLVKEKIKYSAIDSDKDGLSDDWELLLQTDLMNPDTDGDGFKDGTEVNNGHDPLSAKTELLAKNIQVDLATQTLEYSFNNIVLDSFKISSGLRQTPTPKGTFNMLKKRPTVLYRGTNYNYPNTKWNLLFLQGKLGGYYIHGAFWHNNFGQPMSRGCVNVSYANMERLYNWADLNTKVIIK